MGGGGVKWVLVLAMLVFTTTAGAEQKRFWLEKKHSKVSGQRSEISKVARDAMPAVVAITTEQPPTSEDIAAGNNEIQKGLGAGFIISHDGYILTSQHVIEGASKIYIKLPRGDGLPQEFEAKVVGQDLGTDVALLKIDAGRNLPALSLGSSDATEIADWVVCIGNPFGLSHSVSVGVISFKGRSEINPNGREGYFDFIQTDAAINPGNSGGPILNLDGEVIAIANAVNVSGQGIAFALPIDMAKQVLPQLKAEGKVRRGWLGVSVQDLNREVMESFKLTRASMGVVVSDVVPESPGDKAGLRVGDLITNINKQDVLRAHGLRWAVATAGIDSRVSIRVLRDGKPLTMSVKLTELPTRDEEAAMMVNSRNQDNDSNAESTGDTE